MNRAVKHTPRQQKRDKQRRRATRIERAPRRHEQSRPNTPTNSNHLQMPPLQLPRQPRIRRPQYGLVRVVDPVLVIDIAEVAERVDDMPVRVAAEAVDEVVGEGAAAGFLVERLAVEGAGGVVEAGGVGG
ncbi:hypothetical protein V499_08118 [Pseudogymnoascus sp. VKM F-103]|nr:hypothetical protein V499_08118 [Pseudogymnoascus sp. VKM F-103]